MFRLLKSLFQKKEKEIDNNVKYLIAGLGNIGAEYSGTRHNIGFDIIDSLAAQFGVSYKSDRYGFVGTLKHKGSTFILLKPTTYMNLSGQAVRYWMQKEKIELPRVLVVLDDLNIKFGDVRLKPKGSAGGHNGLKNIEELLKTNEYARLRIGIGDAFNRGRQVNFVLGKWSNEEEDKLPAIIEHAAKGVLNFGLIGLEKAMGEVNKKIG